MNVKQIVNEWAAFEKWHRDTFGVEAPQDCVAWMSWQAAFARRASMKLQDDNALMLQLAEAIAASSCPEDERLEVAYAIARYLKLDWPSAYEREPVAEGEVAEDIAAIRAMRPDCVEYRDLLETADLLERTEAARMATEKRVKNLRQKIEKMHGQLDDEFQNRLRLHAQLNAECARSEKLVEALNKINRMAGLKYGSFSHISFEAVKAYQSSKENSHD